MPPVASVIPIPIIPAPASVLWTQTPTPAPAPAPSVSVPVVPPVQLSPQIPPNQLDMHEIAVAPSVTIVLFKLPTRRFTEISHWREVGNNWPAGVKPSLQSFQSRRRLIFLLKLDINVSDHVIGEIVADVKALDLPKPVKFFKDVFVKFFKVFLDLSRIDRLALSIHTRCDHIGALVHVGEEDSRRYRGFVVQTRTSIAVTARAYLEIEWTVHPVLLRAEN